MSPLIIPETQYSLQKRLILAFGILLILFLGLAGLVLDSAFKDSVAAGVEERLQLQVYALLGVAELDAEGFFLPDLEEARFSQIDSGLYGFIFDSAQQELWRSPSALNITLSQEDFSDQQIDPGQTLFGSLSLVQQGNLSYASYGTYWEEQAQAFEFVVMESVEPTDAEISNFQSGLWVGLGGLAVVLAIAQYFLLRWSMRPLQNLAEDVSEIEAGKKDQLNDNYPAELQAVSTNLNLLIKSEREQQSRYRTTLGDLAHSLKTPLAVSFGIVSEARRESAGNNSMPELEEQLERMNQIISWQLKRAAEPHTAKVLGRSVVVASVFTKIFSALNKVYLDKQVQLTSSLQDGVIFFGEESDLMELVGNLLDNAYKYCDNKVVVEVSQPDKKMLIQIDDDGKGIAEKDRQWVLKRGARADTIKSGQGIGLAVAVDIISSYGGEISVDKSTMGGASITVKF